MLLTVNPLTDTVTVQDFYLGRIIGVGGFGKVMVCTENRTGRLFAIKKINKRNVMSSKQLKQIKTENRILKKNCHPFVMVRRRAKKNSDCSKFDKTCFFFQRLKYSFQSEDHIWFVTEFAHGADLARRLAYLGKFYEYLAKFYTAEAVLALEYLHKRGIIHRDLKLENMLLCKDGHIKITDFGLSKDNMEIDKVSNSVCGTQEYIPPEMILNDYYDYSVDWWAVGISMYRMVSKTFEHENNCYTPLLIALWKTAIPGRNTPRLKSEDNDPGDRFAKRPRRGHQKCSQRIIDEGCGCKIGAHAKGCRRSQRASSLQYVQLERFGNKKGT